MKGTKPKGPTVSFVATEELVAALTERAKQEERSMSWLIRKAIEAYLKTKA